jgi:hypothetical protein
VPFLKAQLFRKSPFSDCPCVFLLRDEPEWQWQLLRLQTVHKTLVLLLFTLLRPFGGPANGHGREDDYECDYEGVEELSGQRSSCLTKELAEQLLDGFVSGQGSHETEGGR